MSGADFISVIVPTRARPALLPRAVRSLLGQTHRALEILVIDANPVDERAATRRALAEWGDEPRLRYLEPEAAAGLAAPDARNLGLVHARGEWIAFLDDDDACAPDKLARQLACARGTGAPLVLCGLRYHAGGRRRRVRQCATTQFRGEELLLKAQAASQAIFHRRAPGVRFTACVPAEDADYYHQLIRYFSTDVVPNVPAPLVDIFQQPASARLNADPSRLWRAHRAVWKLHASRYGRRAARLAGARVFFLRAWLGSGSPHLRANAARWLWRLGGRAELRFMLNVILRRVPGVRRLLSV